MFTCLNCGATTEVYSRLCPMCRGEKTLVGQVSLIEAPQNKGDSHPKVMSSGFVAFDNLIGGGFKTQKTYFLTADKGVGKTTLALQACGRIVSQGLSVFFFTGEETKEGLFEKSDRLSVSDSMPEIYEGKNIREIAAIVRQNRPDFIIVDSIQTTTSESTERPSYDMQTTISLQLLLLSRNYRCAVLAIGQVNKDGRASGPNAIAHNFDVVIELKRGVNEEITASTPEKNRLGGLDNRAIFRMSNTGLIEKKEIEVGPLLRHSTPATVGITAFVTDSPNGFRVDEIVVSSDRLSKKPKLTLDSAPSSHAQAIVSVIQRRFNDFQPAHIIRANVTEKLSRTSDLACAVALLSEFYKKEIPHTVAFVATFDTLGNLLPVGNITSRVKRAKEQGFTQVFGPKGIPGQEVTWEEATDLGEVWRKLGF